eukprot:1187044-Prorocentrum_minimum.AAC.3
MTDKSVMGIPVEFAKATAHTAPARKSAGTFVTWRIACPSITPSPTYTKGNNSRGHDCSIRESTLGHGELLQF